MMLNCQRSEDERRDAAQYLDFLRKRFGKFSNEVGKFPTTVREAQPIPLALQIQPCLNAVMRSLTFNSREKEFQDAVYFVDWICNCLSECVWRSDAILDKAILHTAKPRIFVSYAWGDRSSEDARKRMEVVNRLCETLKKEGWDVIRDTKVVRFGDLISRFITRIGRADKVIAVLSDKYLHSPYCMTELYSLFQRAIGEKKGFLARIIPLVLEDAHIGTPEDRVKYAMHWKTRYENLSSKLDCLGVEDVRLWQNMKKWHVDVGNMLTYVNDVLAPHGFDDIVRDEFAALRQMLSRRHRQKKPLRNP
jgi:internalin A